MSSTSKQQREIEAHNRLAEQVYRHQPEETFHVDRVVQGLLDLAGDLQGKTILECGCGRGLFTRFLVEQGAQVVAFDISDKMVELARERLGQTDRVTFLVGAIEALELDAQAFDLVLGLDILHHIELQDALPRIRQWLKPGGKALFVENLGFNPLLAGARMMLAGRFGIAKYGTDDERPLSHGDVRLMRRVFDRVTLHIPQMIFCQIFSRNVLRYRYLPWLQRLFEQIDEGLYRYCPALHWLSYKVVVVLE